MLGNDDWRFAKAQALGLHERAPVAADADRRNERDTLQIVRPQPPAPAPPVAEPPSRSGFASVRVVAGIAAALLAGAAGGWVLRGGIDRPDTRGTTTAAPAARVAVASGDANPGAAVTVTPIAEAVADPSPPTASPPALPPPMSRPTPPMAEKSPAAVSAAADHAPQRIAALDSQLADSRRADSRQTKPAPPVRATTPRAAPGFNCRRARSDVYRAICADTELAALDRAMSSTYRAAVRAGGGRNEGWLDREQASFLNARAACETPGCIARLTRRRLRDLAEDQNTGS